MIKSDLNSHPPRRMDLCGKVMLIGLMLLILTACSPNGAHTADKKGQTDNILRPNEPDAPNRWKRVIVRLDVADLDQMQAQAAGQKDPVAAKALDQKIAQRIAAVADRVIKHVEPAGAKLVRRYPTLPLLALNVSPRAMAILESMPEVLSIEADQLNQPVR